MSLPGPSLPGYPPAPGRGPVSQSDCRCVAWAVSRDTGSTGGVGTLSPSCLRAPFSPQDTVSVHRPSFYAERFFKFMSNTVFRKNSCELPRPSGQEGPQGCGAGRWGRQECGKPRAPPLAMWPSVGLGRALGPENRGVRTPLSWGPAWGLGPAV